MTRPPAPKKPATAAFKNLYHELDRATLSQQGADHLRGKADVRARRVGHWLWLIVGGLIGGAVCVGGGFCIWLLHTAKNSGQKFSEVREQVLRSYSDETPPDDSEVGSAQPAAQPAAPPLESPAK